MIMQLMLLSPSLLKTIIHRVRVKREKRVRGILKREKRRLIASVQRSVSRERTGAFHPL